MKIEVAIEGREPYGHAITKEKTIIGSGDDCDLVLKIKGVSRKHVMVINDNEQFFIIDQGSTEGTFINDEQLVPGQRAEFTSFFPVKLGPYITLSLASEETLTETFEFAKELPTESTTSESSLSRSEKTNPEIIERRRQVTSPEIQRPVGIERRKGARRVKPAPTKAQPLSEDAKRMRNTKILALLIAAGGATFFYMNKEAPLEEAPVVANSTTNPAGEAAPKMSLKDLVFNFERPPISGEVDLLNEGMCNTSKDFELCEKLGLPSPEFRNSGIGIREKYLQFFIPPATMTELWDKFKAKLGVQADLSSPWPEQMDPRDVLAIYLYALHDSDWAFITDNHRWIYGTVLTPVGTIEKIFFVDAQKIKAALIAKKAELQASLNKGNIELLWPISGFFRELTPVASTQEPVEAKEN